MAGVPGFTLGDIVSANAVRFPDTVAYQSAQRGVTHTELNSRAIRLASAMAQVGVGRQDRVVLFGRNSVEFCEVLAAGHLSGIIIATPNWRWSESEVQEAIRRVSPKLLFCDAEFGGIIAAAADGQALVRDPVVFGTDFEALLASGGERLPFSAQAQDLALLLFTSGTTGGSKCCIEGHREFHGILQAMSTTMRTGSADRALINMPMCHIGAMAIAGGVHVNGGTVILQQQFDAREALELAASERITVMHLAPVMLQRLLDEPDVSEALATVRTVVYSAAPMTATLLGRALDALPHANFVNLYGQTEGIVSGLPPELHTTDSGDALGSVGFPSPGVRVRVVDEHGAEVDAGGTGEIAIQSESLFRGYWNDHAATLATVQDGWYHTGDIGRFDERGLLYLVDRKKDVIITGGENVYSPEVENAVSAVSGVAECAVVGVADDVFGEAVCAVVVPEPDADVSLQAIRREVSKGLARYKIPRLLVVTAELPRLGSGKVDKRRLRAELAAGERS